jgi:hypothetical protein
MNALAIRLERRCRLDIAVPRYAGLRRIPELFESRRLLGRDEFGRE